tara:strand:- start:1096 stop:2118 length:1023 start_codon:yes stop_codon:yes gene_type:complete
MKFDNFKGVIGVVSNDPSEVDLAVKNKLNCIEVRADLLINIGFSIDEICKIVKTSRLKDLFCLFTLRHQKHGGKFFGTEKERIQINKLAFEEGANCIDLEWGTEAEVEMNKEDIPLIISSHDFDSMPTNDELNKLTIDIERHSPLAIKVVPTASEVAHSVQILNWVRGRTKNNICRIGFAMGKKGVCSRILTTVFGSPITYAAFGKEVASGQISMEKTINLYRVPKLERGCFIFGVAGEDVNDSKSIILMNNYLKKKQINAVSIPLEITNFEELFEIAEDLKIIGVQLEYPLKEIVIKKLLKQGKIIKNSIFIEFFIDNGAMNYRIICSSGYSFLKKKYR